MLSEEKCFRTIITLKIKKISFSKRTDQAYKNNRELVGS